MFSVLIILFNYGSQSLWHNEQSATLVNGKAEKSSSQISWEANMTTLPASLVLPENRGIWRIGVPINVYVRKKNRCKREEVNRGLLVSNS